MVDKKHKSVSSRVQVTFTRKQIEKIDKLKEDGLGRSRSDVVNKLVIQWLLEHKKLEGDN
jgi:metal-responsive CopG/Arc/MetJ family transcriptional regulator